MATEPKNRYSGISVDEHMEELKNDLDYDLVFFGYAIYSGRNSFELSGSHLIDFVRRCFLEVLNHGGILHADEGSDPRWMQAAHAGLTNEQLADRFIDIWQSLDKEPDWWSLHFYLTHDEIKRRKAEKAP